MKKFKALAEHALLGGFLELAKFNYCKYLEMNPKDAEVLNNVGALNLNNEEISSALEYFYRAVMNSNRVEYKANFIQAFIKCDYADLKQEYLELISKLLRSNLIRPIDAAIKIYNSIKNNLTPDKINYKIVSEDNLIVNLTKISNSQVFLTLLRTTHIPSIEFEIQLNLISESITQLVLSDNKYILRFKDLIESLAIQSKLKEYIHIDNNNSYYFIGELKYKFKIEKNIKIKILIANLIIYFQCSNDFVDFILDNTNNDELSDFWSRYVFNPYKFNTEKIENHISLKIKNQYEINPYPKWIYTYIPVAKQDFSVCYKKNGLVPPKNENLFRILVAGCGTGQHAIQTACTYANSDITAIDLSLASLTYAQRKSDDLNIKNINFINSDILEFKKEDKKFDLIESIGVLHHMQNPTDGFNALRTLLSDNGLMKIGLYSRKARESIYQIQSMLSLNKEIKDQEHLISERKRIIKFIEDAKKYDDIYLFSDFYNLSEFKDLFFNECEHSFNLMEIAEILRNSKLNFLSLEINTNILKFAGFTGVKPKSNDLKAWAAIEEEYPLAFSGMYIFWCNKA